MSGTDREKPEREAEAVAWRLSLSPWFPVGFLHWWEALPGNVRGVIWILLAGFSFTLTAALVKGLGQELHPFQIIFIRCLFGLVWLVPFFWRQGWAPLATQRPGAHALRSLFGVLAMGSTFYAYALLPLADVVALAFTVPLYMIPLARLFLGEPLDRRRIGAAGVGFLGVLIMLRPGSQGFDPLILIAVVSPLLIAGVRTVVKRMTDTEGALTIVARYGMISSLFWLPAALIVWEPPRWAHLGPLIAISGLATAAQSAMIRAYAVGDATAITPFDYARILIATAIGFWFFAEIPDPWTLLGAGVIMASNLWLLRRLSLRGRG